MRNKTWLYKMLSVVVLISVSLFLSSVGSAFGSAETLLFDEFNGTTLDTGLWFFRTHSNNNASAIVEDGILTIHSGQVDGSGGGIESNQTFLVGANEVQLLEMRVKNNATDGGNWGWSGDNNDGLVYFQGWPTGELRAAILPCNPGCSPAYIIFAGVDVTAWHTYRIELTQSAAKFYIDGELVGTQLNNLPINKPMRVVVNRNSRGIDQTINVEYVKLSQMLQDTTAPVIVPSVTLEPNGLGWNKTDVNVSWSVSDAETGIASSSGCGAATLTTETNEITLTCSATNGAGLSNSVSITVKIDKTAPIMTISRTPAANANGWNNSDVTVSFNCTDTLSGVASVSGPTTISSEGANQSVTGICTDKAGNSANATVDNISIDKTAPSINVVAPLNGALYLQNQVVQANYNCSDALSQVASCVGTVPSGNNIDTSTIGSKNFVVSAVDKADNSATKSLSYNIWGIVGPFPPLVKNGQGTGQFKSGSTVPVKFQLTDGSNLVTTAVGTISIDASIAEIRWDSSAQQYIANVKLLSTSGTYPVTLNVNGVGSITIATITVR